MTDPDTIAAFNASRAARDTTPDSTEETDGVPTEPLADVPTAPMRLPHDTIPNPFVGDDDWEGDEVTAVREVPRLRKPHDPTGCMM